VTKEEFDAKTAAVLANEKVVETPDVDTEVLVDLLGLTPEAVGKTYVWFPTGGLGESCEKCGRVFSFLDIAESGLKVHTKEFMAELITGKRGYIVNGGDTQEFNCHGCGALGRVKPAGYHGPTYGCPK
jgi:predicted RNA-binding Zn-ribbon protein involved in translation (DUF1610 family)